MLSSMSSISLSAAISLVRSTLSAQLPSLVPIISASYIFSTSTGMTLSPMAAILSLPELRASPRRCCTILFFALCRALQL
ncbi:hypothetical protein HYQ46_001837 [Verticillium longisporum]|nr:hypothetical protein HYQ46_001837 [Verticillium longisporum]